MKTLPVFLLASVAVLSFSASAPAEEKNGLSVSVSKTTLEKNDTRGAGYYSDRINRTQALKAVIKNVSFKEMPEGEVIWTVLVKRYSYADIASFTGTEKLKALKPAEASEMVFGSAQITGYSGYSETYKDKTEWQITVKQDGKELIKTQSTSTFDQMAKRAIKGEKPEKRD